MKHTHLVIDALPILPPIERTWSHCRKNFDTNCTTFLYVLNSGVTEPNLTKLLQDVQKWLPITLLKSKLWSSNPFWNNNVTNEDRHQGESRQKLRILTAKNIRDCWTEVHQIWIRCSLIIAIEPLCLWLANPLSNAEAKSEGRSMRRRLYNFLCLKLQGHWTESQQLSTSLKGVQKWLPITLLKSKLRSSNPFRNANVTSKDRRQMRANCGKNWTLTA